MSAMTVDIRAAAEAEAAARYMVDKDDHNLALAFAELRREGFAEGAVWAHAQLTPTREQIADELRKHKLIHAAVSREAAFCVCNSSVRCGTKANREWFEQHQADAVLALLQTQAGRDGE